MSFSPAPGLPPVVFGSVLAPPWFHKGLGIVIVIVLGAATAHGSGTTQAASLSALLENGPPVSIHEAHGEIAVDGDLSDPGWQDVAPVDSWYETRPADNVPASLRSVARITYDGAYLYVAFDLEDPDPTSIRAPIRDRDEIHPTVDFAGLYLDPAGEGKLAQEFAGTPSGVQYDGLWSEATGPDSSPDFFWECAGKTNDHGWTLEMRIPFSSLRYRDPDPSHWGILLYRSIPRSFRYEYYSSRMPRDRACMLCNARALQGLQGLPSGSHWVAAPFVSASGLSEASDGPGSALGDIEGTTDVGLDLKWLPSPSTVVDATWNPDFSQIESDTAQITANERFALFVPEKRTFFMESADLFTTPLGAAYTRTITSPRWGVRSSGVGDGYTYTVLAGEDRGGGLVVIPGPEGSELASQDFSSHFAIGRVRMGIGGRSFASLLVTDREIDGGGYNRVIGPDLEWWPSERDVVLGQVLLSWSRTPERPDLADEWDGRKLSGYAGELTWLRRTSGWDAALSYQETSDDFRADNGFMPQVGFRKGYGEIGYTFWPKDSPVTRLRLFTISRYLVDQQGELLQREITPGFGFDSILDSFVRVELGLDEIRSGDALFRRVQLRPTVTFTPGKLVSRVEIQARIGDEVDFVHSRPADGLTLQLATEARPSDRLQLALLLNRRWLEVTDQTGREGRLFTADVARLKAVYSFSVRSWVRLITQWVGDERDPGLWDDEVEGRSGDLAGSLTFAYKLNWQTVLYVGYADTRALDETDALRQADRQAFLKLSYAFQR